MGADFYPHQPADDGLLVRDANSWAIDKLDIVSCYVTGFVNACKGARSCQVVDGFGGPGVNRIDGRLEWGTPIRVLRSTPEVDRVLAMDLDATAIEALATRTSPDDRATVVAGDVNTDLIPAMNTHLERQAPTLAILDPEGTELDFDTIRALARWRVGARPVEVLVLFPTDTGFIRMLPREGDGFDYAPEKLTRMFGTDEWEPIWRRRQEAGDDPEAPARALRAYARLYERQLNSAGYTHVLDREIRRQGREGRRGYLLMFASGHPAGENIMDHCFNTVYPSNPQLAFPGTERRSHLRP